MPAMRNGTERKGAASICCPSCRMGLRLDRSECRCVGCGLVYPVVDGIPQLFVPNEWPASEDDVTEAM